MEQLSENQKQDLIRKRQEMLRNMGVKNAGQMMSESVVGNGAQTGMAAKLAAIRNGGAKAEINKFISATGKNAGGRGEFQGIPEPTKRKNPNQASEQVKPEYSQKLESFDAGHSSELASIEALMGGDSMSSRGGSQMMSHNPMSQELSIDSMVMPSFNPQAVIQQRARSQAQAQAPSESPYLKFAGEPTQQDFVEVDNQPMANMGQLQKMMETIAKGIAEKTIKNVLNEYSEQQKGKVFFEYYNKEKNIIKTPDGKYYKLTQVEFKKKS
jgi:hypothetical protein